MKVTTAMIQQLQVVSLASATAGVASHRTATQRLSIMEVIKLSS